MNKSMTKLKHIIITASDKKYGDFLINHWLKSLKNCTNLKNIDILVLDYGLTSAQIKLLLDEKVIVKKCRRDGHVVTIRYRDTADFLSKHSYDQVLLIDSGDIIFQEDITPLFEKNKTQYRAFCEKFILMNYNTLLPNNFFKNGEAEKMKKILKGKRVVNGGVIIGPAKKMQSFSRKIYSLILNKDAFWADQTAANYVLYKEGFKILPDTYNFVLNTGGTDFTLKKGKFYLKNGEKIAIVHNAGGGTSFFRSINKFGHGPGYNKSKRFAHHFQKVIARIKTKLTNY
jgi:hypothetical protein